jgi:hypothetical protein
VSTVPNISDDAQRDDGVSPSAAKRLRDAMDRLLAGRPQRTDGRLIKDNLWKEAGLSRATMNRAARILAEWNCRVAECDGFTPSEARKNDEVATLRKKLEDKTREYTELHHRLDAAATAIAALHHDNVLLRQELNNRGQLVALQVHR